MTIGTSHSNQFDKPTYIYRGIKSDISFLCHFSDEINVSKQNSPRRDAAKHVASLLRLFCLPISHKKRTLGMYGLTENVTVCSNLMLSAFFFQLIHRILLIFMPAKYQPDHSYLRHVPIKRVHMFTAIQVVCLVLLWIVKTIKKISIAFPLMVGTVYYTV